MFAAKGGGVNGGGGSGKLMIVTGSVESMNRYLSYFFPSGDLETIKLKFMLQRLKKIAYQGTQQQIRIMAIKYGKRFVQREDSTQNLAAKQKP